MQEIVKTCKKHGALTALNVNKGNRCKLCNIEHTQNWKILNREKHRASANTKRNTDPAAKIARNAKERFRRATDNTLFLAQSKRYRDKIGNDVRNTREIARVRGLSVIEYEKICKEQGEKCAICKLPETRKGRGGKVCRLCLDHDHATGKTRQLLCHSCNTGIGKFKENIKTMQKAILYLQKHKGFK